MKAVRFAFVVYFVLLILALYWANDNSQAPVLALTLAFGAMGACVRETLDARKQPPTDWHAPAFSPLVGAAIALMLMLLFLSGLVTGDLFPQFLNADAPFDTAKGALRGGVTLVSNADFFKLIAWSMLAGYSEKFVLSKIDSLFNRQTPKTDATPTGT